MFALAVRMAVIFIFDPTYTFASCFIPVSILPSKEKEKKKQ